MQHASGRVKSPKSIFKHRPRFIVVVSLLFISVLVVATIAPSLLTGTDPMGLSPRDRYNPPSPKFVFGTDNLGRDMFARVVSGARVSLLSAVAIVGLALTLGTTVGVVAGHYGGFIGAFLMRVTDIFLSFPNITLAIVVAAVLGRGLDNAIIAVSLSLWPQFARLARVETLKLRELEFVAAARALGASESRVIWRHITPNLVSPLLVKATFDLGLSILAVASLSFIGLGASPPMPEWGRLIAAGRGDLMEGWWISLMPGLVLVMTIISFNVVADELNRSLGVGR